MKCRFIDRSGFEAWLEVSNDHPPTWRVAAPPPPPSLKESSPWSPPSRGADRVFECRYVYGEPGCRPTEFIYVEPGGFIPDNPAPSPDQVQKLVQVGHSAAESLAQALHAFEALADVYGEKSPAYDTLRETIAQLLHALRPFR